MNKAIVTGANGFLATWLIRELRKNDLLVYAIIREQAVADKWMLEDEKIIPINCDMENYYYLPKIINETSIDYVFHLSWMGNSTMGTSLLYETQLNNVLYGLKLIEAAHFMNVKRFICTGSIHEIELITELFNNYPFDQTNHYYKSAKLSLHAMGKTLAAQYNIEYFNPILFNTYGEYDTSNRLVSYVISTMLDGKIPSVSSGKQLYELLHVSDVVHALYLIAVYGKNGCEYSITTGNFRPLKEYLVIIEKIVNQYTNQKICLDFGGHQAPAISLDKYKIIDSSLLRYHTGFKPKVSFENGIKRTMQWLIEQKQRK